jgi:RNA polymerase sigma-70 factor (ECF subfamily)
LNDSSSSLELLYRQHAPAAFRRARRMLGDDGEAHEIVHDVFVSLLNDPGQHAGRSGLATFLYSAVTHACLNRIRSRRTRERLASERPLLEGNEPALDPERQLILRSALRELPELLAQVAVYYYMDELTHDEIGRILGCSRRHVGNLLDRLFAHPVQKELRSCS